MFLVNIDSSLTLSIDWYDVVNVAALADISEQDFFFFLLTSRSRPPPSRFPKNVCHQFHLGNKQEKLSNKAIPELQTISDMRHVRGVNEAIDSGFPHLQAGQDCYLF